jgi:mono/diheme cytochrome c family protein
VKLPKTATIVLIVILVEIAAAAGAFLIVTYSGVYNVAATDPHYDSTVWVLSTTMDYSVRRHAAGIAVSETYKSPNLAEGAERFREMCVTCHGAPGVGRSEIGQGLYPNAPDLKVSADDWTPPELYWIIRNGIKMSGMPAFGPTQTDEKLWNITAFVKRLPDMTPEEYKQMGSSARSKEQSGH